MRHLRQVRQLPMSFGMFVSTSKRCPRHLRVCLNRPPDFTNKTSVRGSLRQRVPSHNRGHTAMPEGLCERFDVMRSWCRYCLRSERAPFLPGGVTTGYPVARVVTRVVKRRTEPSFNAFLITSIVS